MNWRDYVIINESNKRKFDIISNFGDPRTLKRELGWENKKHINEIIDLLMNGL